MSRVTIDHRRHIVEPEVAAYIKKLRDHIAFKRGRMQIAAEIAFKIMEQSFPTDDKGFKNMQYRMAVHDCMECLTRYGLIAEYNWETGEITMPEEEING